MKQPIFILSPSKSLSKLVNTHCVEYSQPKFIQKSSLLVNELKKISLQDLEKITETSSKLAMQSMQWFLQWNMPFTLLNSRQAILTFAGDVYSGLNVKDFDSLDFDYAQSHVRILSALYGLLMPLDLIQPYRLEMGSKFKVDGKQTLYKFWEEIVTDELSLILKNGILVNLASQEYFKTLDVGKLKCRLLNIEFRESKPEGLKIIPTFAKRARGLMTRFAVKNKIEDVDSLKLFDYEGYMYNDLLSTPDKWVFVR